ncbi:NmrA family NAD(P)-binding protein [Spirosoma aerophilum]
MKIVVTGSLGHISQPLATELVQKGHSVTVISSQPGKRPAIEALGATAAIGSLADVDFLTTAFAGADAVYAMVPPNFPDADVRAYYGRIGRNYVQAIGQSGVQRVVYLSSYGADLDEGTGLILGAHDVEGMLGQLPDVAVTYLRPTYFYYNLYAFVGMIKGAGMIAANYGGDDKLVMVAPADIAVVAAEALTAPEPVSGVRYIASDERTGTEIARLLGEAIGKPDLTWTVISDGQMQAGMEANGLPPQLATSFVEMFASVRTGAMPSDYYRHPPKTMGAVKLEDFVQEFAAVYKG